MDLKFKRAKKEKEIQEVLDYNVRAFSDSPDFNWNLEEIKQEIADGWELFAVFLEDEIIAAVFLKDSEGTLFTKNTAIKAEHQGDGHSHSIKKYFEETAKSKKLKRIVHYCKIDNFRMYSLNERHGYKKRGEKNSEDILLIEWEKIIK